MKTPTFIHGVFVAAVLAMVASAFIATLTPFVGFSSVVKLAIPALAFAYLLFLLRHTEERTGRLTVLTVWSLATAALWWFSPPLSLYLLLHVGAIWLLRSLYFYTGVIPAFADLGVSLSSIAMFGWAIEKTGSIFLGIWSFFLVQALFVLIPKTIGKGPAPAVSANEFDRARRQAERALQQLYTNNSLRG